MRNALEKNLVVKRALLLVAIVMLPSIAAFATKLDLSGSATDGSLPGAVGGTAIFSETSTHPAGTGVFDPFLTINSQGNSKTEQGYNTDGHTALYLDQQRPEWNNLLKVSDLAKINIGGTNYYAFELDANEPSGMERDHSAKVLLSVDNIRIYTSSTDNTGAVQSDVSKLETPSPLGTLRFALNDPLKSGSNFNITNWVKMAADTDGIADTQGHNGGSGFSDLIVYIPASDFPNLNDYIFFYNLNGAHFQADVGGDAAEGGYEEWRAVVRTDSVPDGGNTLVLLGSALLALGLVGRRCYDGGFRK
jgi:protein with PEP-CTERM/exosortase system signal